MSQKSTNNKCWRGCGEKGTILQCWWECKLIQPLWKIVWSRTTIWSSSPTIGHIPWGNQNWKRHLYPNVHCSTIYIIARTWKQPRCPSADEWIRKLWYIYTMEYYSAIKKSSNEVDETGAYYTEWIKSDRETPKQHINVYMILYARQLKSHRCKE